MEPLRRLTRKNAEWTWSEEQNEAFNEVKRLVSQAPVLSNYQPDRPLSVQCNASQKGLVGTSRLAAARELLVHDVIKTYSKIPRSSVVFEDCKVEPIKVNSCVLEDCF